jgi:predicted enzyme related to lactoylglutathione lyase
MTYTMFKVGDRPNGGAYDASTILPEHVPSNWAVYFTVEDCDAAVAAIEAHGGTVMQEPTDVSVGRMAACADPQGASFMVIALAEES